MATVKGFAFSPLSAASAPMINPAALQFVDGGSLAVGPTSQWNVPSLADVSDIVLAGLEARNRGVLSGVESLFGGIEKGATHLLDRRETLEDEERRRAQELEDDQRNFQQSLELANLKDQPGPITPLDNAREAYWRAKTSQLGNEPEVESPFISPSDTIPPGAVVPPESISPDALGGVPPLSDELEPPLPEDDETANLDLSSATPFDETPEGIDPLVPLNPSLENVPAFTPSDVPAPVVQPQAEQAPTDGRFWAGQDRQYLKDAVPIAGLPNYYQVTRADGKTQVIHAPQIAQQTESDGTQADIEGFIKVPVSTMADGRIKYKFVPAGVDGAAAVTGRPLLQGQMSVLTNIANADFTLGQIEGKIKEISDRGPIVGQARARNPYDTQAQALENMVNSLVPGLARGVFGEVGVLTDEDIARYKAMIPNIKTNPALANEIIKDLKAKLGSTRQNNLDVWQKAGYNVGAFAPAAPSEAEGRMAAIEAQLKTLSADDPKARPLIDEYKRLKGGQ